MELEWKELYISVINRNKSIKTKYVELVKCSSGLVKSGEIQVLMGPSGGGKSTLMNLLAGRVPPGSLTHGNIKYNGKFRDPSDEWFDVIEFVEQEPCFLEDLTVYETLLCSYRFSKKKRINQQKRIEARNKSNELDKSDEGEDSKIEEIINDFDLNCSEFIGKIIKDLGLDDVKDNLISKLSGGEKKRTSIGMALASRPEIMFFDEPTSGLDTATSRDIIGLLKNLAVKYKKIVILTIHQPSLEIFTQFDKLILISKGNVLYDGRIENVESYFIEKGYVKNELASTPEFILDICHNNSRNKNQDLVNKENDNLNVQKVILNNKTLKKNNDNHIYATFSISDVYYLILRQLYIRRKKKWKFLKTYFFNFMFLLAVLSFWLFIDYRISSNKKEHEIQLNNNREIHDKMRDSTEHNENNLNEMKEKILKIQSSFDRCVVALKLVFKQIFYTFNCTLIGLMISTISGSFYTEFSRSKLEICNHQYSSSSFYIFMFIQEVFMWTIFSSIFCAMFSIYFKSFNIIFLTINLLAPILIAPYAFTIASITPNLKILPVFIIIFATPGYIPAYMLKCLYKKIEPFCMMLKYCKFIPYLFYFFAFLPSTYFSEIIELYFKSREESSGDKVPESSDLILTFLKGTEIKSDKLYLIMIFLTFFYFIASFVLSAYRQGPAIRMITQKA